MLKKKENIKIISNRHFFEELILFLNEGKKVLFTIKGNSMKPFICNGEKVLIRPYRSNELTLGTIVLAKYGNGVILHRIVSKKNEKILLAGDGNLWQREQISSVEVLGIVDIVIRNNEWIKLDTSIKQLMALCWYLIRPIRILFYKINKLIN